MNAMQWFVQAAVAWAACAAPAAEWKVREKLDVAPVWAGHPVSFSLLTAGDRQFAAFYDAERRMTVAQRPLAGGPWRLQTLPSQVGWDSHNSVTMAVDERGCLHVSGNMHCVPLVYFRSRRPYDAASLERAAMVGREEDRVTYPAFVRGPRQELIFTYRHGRSGNGEQVLNVYDPAAQTWRRLLDEPLFSGGGKMNAYFRGPVRDAAGVFHVCWVWRNTPDCATNHDLSYARSRDLVHWQTSAGQPLTLPLTLATGEIVDPVPPGGGLLNGNTHIGFDGQGRVVIAYHKFDAAGKTQLFNARLEDGRWKPYQTSDWDYRWAFSGGGTIRGEIGFGPVTVQPDGSLTQSYHHITHGSGAWRLDAATLRPLGPAPRGDGLPRELGKVESPVPGMSVRFAHDLAETATDAAKAAAAKYVLRWETLPANRDRPHPGDPPPPSMLRLYVLEPPAPAGG
jgi:hypothetical protein